jgi:hypothetical protein
MSEKKREGPPLPHAPAPYHLADLTAVQAVAGGTATPDQQRRAMQWIVESACDTYGLGWHPEGGHAASFVAGRRFGGLQVVKAIKINVGLLKKGGENG